jgi:HEPN domain-containing protein
MRPFTIWHFLTQSFPGWHEKIVPMLLEKAEPDMIYVLGASLYRRRSESIFCPEAPSSQQFSDYCFLLLMNDLKDKTVYEWQDKIEQHCSSTLMPVTVIILQTSAFDKWLKQGRLFAWKVYALAPLVYDSGKTTLSATGDCNVTAEQKKLEKYYRQALNRSLEFMAGADLFRVRNQNTMAAFMLHQAAEQALRALLKIGTGFHCHTHNIERLIRYAGMVSYRLPYVFPNKTEREKRVFNLLKRAYTETRYKEDYSITGAELLLLADKVKMIQGILSDTAKSLFNTL